MIEYENRRTVVSIPCGPSALAVKEAAWGLARYAAISQVCLCFAYRSALKTYQGKKGFLLFYVIYFS